MTVVVRAWSTVSSSFLWTWVVRLPSTVCVSSFSTSMTKSFCAWILIDSLLGSSSITKWLASSPLPLIVRLMKPLTVALAGSSSGGIWSAL